MKVRLGSFDLAVATDFGPRITSLRFDGGPELMAKLDADVALVHDGGTFEFRGGHRLWAAPEDPAVTYAPDNHTCTVEESNGSTVVSAPPDAAGLSKEIVVSHDEETLVVSHRIQGSLTQPIAAWGITQLPLGGTAILPLVGDDTGPTANRNLVIWPYTSLEDRRVTLGDDVVEITAVGGPPLKFGVGPNPGRLGYYLDGTLFVKEIEPVAGREVPDLGAVGQVYVGQGFCELESVGGLTDLANGGEASLQERWIVTEVGDLETAIEVVVDR